MTFPPNGLALVVPALLLLFLSLLLLLRRRRRRRRRRLLLFQVVVAFAAVVAAAAAAAAKDEGCSGSDYGGAVEVMTESRQSIFDCDSDVVGPPPRRRSALSDPEMMTLDPVPRSSSEPALPSSA